MATTDSVGNTQLGSAFDKLAASLNAGAKTTEKTNKNELGKDAFIKMLVEQLKNQDPTEPIKNEDLAVNLAQFSQVEQLVDINKKLDGGGLSDSASLAAFLGREVSVDGSDITVAGGKSGSVSFDLPLSTSETKLQVLNSSGSVVKELDLGARANGKQQIDLSNLGVADGTYSLQVNAVSVAGENFSPALSTGGVVTGFIPGSDPSLLIGDKEVKVADIKVVNTPK